MQADIIPYSFFWIISDRDTPRVNMKGMYLIHSLIRFKQQVSKILLL